MQLPVPSHAHDTILLWLGCYERWKNRKLLTPLTTDAGFEALIEKVSMQKVGDQTIILFVKPPLKPINDEWVSFFVDCKAEGSQSSHYSHGSPQMKMQAVLPPLLQSLILGHLRWWIKCPLRRKRYIGLCAFIYELLYLTSVIPTR